MRTMATYALFVLALGACDRTHMSPNFGVPNRDAFAAQVIRPDAGNEVKPDQPLDPEEAATIARTYKRSLAPATQTDPGVNRNMLLVVPPQQGNGLVPAPAQGAEAR
jgi:hypothetical protein